VFREYSLYRKGETGKVKAKLALEQSIKAQKGSRGIAVLFL
jgi:hypothetical protein